MASVHGKPEEGAECECYFVLTGSRTHTLTVTCCILACPYSNTHPPSAPLPTLLRRCCPPPSSSGLATYEDLDETNYVEYQVSSTPPPHTVLCELSSERMHPCLKIRALSHSHAQRRRFRC